MSNLLPCIRLSCLVIICLLAGLSTSAAQDAFFRNFHNHGSLFNPALVAESGSRNFSTQYKSQWGKASLPYFQSMSFSYEESIPCSIFDFGINVLHDKEGSGILETFQGGFQFRGSGSFKAGEALNNISFGLGFQFSWKQIDWSRLIFSDELDPKYGTRDVLGFDLPTEFIPPEGNTSNVFATPSMGVVYKLVSNPDAAKPLSASAGIAMHNLLNFGRESLLGESESLLNTQTLLPRRLTLFAEFGLVLHNDHRNYISLQPSIVYQQQSQLDYIEFGALFRLSQGFGVGAFYHTTQRPDEGRNTSWYTLVANVGVAFSSQQQVDLQFSFSRNQTGLTNFVQPIFELGLSWHIAGSWPCNIMGRGDEVPYGHKVRCPLNQISPGKKKIYNNIWYRTIHNR